MTAGQLANARNEVINLKGELTETKRQMNESQGRIEAATVLKDKAQTELIMLRGQFNIT
jgi:hypothetical protein